MVYMSEAKGMGLGIAAVIRRFNLPDGTGWQPVEEVRLPVDPGVSGDQGVGVLAFGGAVWKVMLGVGPVPDRPDAIDISAEFKVISGKAEDVAVNLEVAVDGWSEGNYVLIPAVAYGGNRFEVRDMPYPPMLKDPKDLGPDVPTIISGTAPHLSLDNGTSVISQDTGDPSTPAIAYRDSKAGKGFILLTRQQTVLGNSGLTLEEHGDIPGTRDKCTIGISAPSMRRDRAKGDTPATLASGTCGTKCTVTLDARLYAFPCPTVQALFDRFAEVRKDLTGPVSLVDSLPFSHAWSIQEDKFNGSNWNGDSGYYRVGTNGGQFDDWQLGWVGGGMTTYPLLAKGSALSRERALRNLDFIFTTQTASGLMHGIIFNGDAFGDGFFNPGTKDWHLIRKSADALYFLFKHFALLKRRAGQEWTLPEAWESGTRKLADAFVTMWRKYGQFGQFVDVHTGEIIVGGSTSASMAPGGLALAWEWFGDPEYLEVSQASARHFYERDVKAGITTGGPGEILQNPDSESAFGLLESFVTLFEATGETEWLDCARDMARQAATWCVPYDYAFPADSEFGRLGIRATGSIIANSQNKHSAPGICTLSGDSLFKLHRYTGDIWFLELAREIVHNCGQYLSREDRPIRCWDGRFLPPGWMCERVNMSDWEGRGNIGGVFYGSCWCETSNMLGYAELPGIYVRPDTGLVSAFDHIGAVLTDEGLLLDNSTAYDSTVRLMVETEPESRGILGQGALADLPEVFLAAGGSKLIPNDELMVWKNRI